MSNQYQGVDTAFAEWIQTFGLNIEDVRKPQFAAIREAFEAGFRAGQFDSRRWAAQAGISVA